MRIDYEVGDVVVKIAGTHGLNIGKIGRVKDIFTNPTCGRASINLEGWDNGGEDSEKYSHWGWLATNFKKLPKADEDFTAYMRKMKPKQTEKPRCPLTGEPLTVQERFEQECG